MQRRGQGLRKRLGSTITCCLVTLLHWATNALRKVVTKTTDQSHAYEGVQAWHETKMHSEGSQVCEGCKSARDARLRRPLTYKSIHIHEGREARTHHEVIGKRVL